MIITDSACSGGQVIPDEAEGTAEENRGATWLNLDVRFGLIPDIDFDRDTGNMYDTYMYIPLIRSIIDSFVYGTTK